MKYWVLGLRRIKNKTGFRFLIIHFGRGDKYSVLIFRRGDKYNVFNYYL
jgi:hypothetical protein